MPVSKDEIPEVGKEEVETILDEEITI